LWQEGHTVHATSEEAEKEVIDILEIYKNTVEQVLAIPVVTGKKSEKEKFVGAVYTTTMESMMPDGKALQMGTSHFLGQNFSKPFDVKFLDKNNVETFAWQTSWGVSWRLIGAMIMVHGDDKGLVLPPRVAPIQIVIVPIYYSEKDAERILVKADEVEKILQKKKLRVHVDKRDELTPGFKFNDWELKGVPLRIEIGPKDLDKNKVTVARRHNRQKSDLPLDKIESDIESILYQIQDEMFLAAEKILKERTVKVTDYNQFKSELENGAFITAYWCGKTNCEEKIKEETMADIRVIPFENKDTAGKCVYCGEKNATSAIFARAY
jgi:prolyl-tRNA synthetase